MTTWPGPGATRARGCAASRRSRRPDALALELGIPAGTEVYAFERLRYAGAEPLALLRNHVPAGLLRLTPGDLEAQGLYNLLRANGINLRIAKQSIGARAATAAEARALGEARGAPLLTMVRAAYDDQGRRRWSTGTTSTGPPGTASISP